MAVARREKWAKKAHFCGGLSVGDSLSLPAPPLYCEGKHMFRPVCPLLCTNVHADASHSPVSGTGVTAAFYKVRDFFGGDVHSRLSRRFILPSLLHHLPLDPFSLELLSSRHPRSRIAIAMHFNSRSTSRCLENPSFAPRRRTDNRQ